MAVTSHLLHKVWVSRKSPAQISLNLRQSIVISLPCLQLFVLSLQFCVVFHYLSLRLWLTLFGCAGLHVPLVCLLAEHMVPAILATATNTLVFLLWLNCIGIIMLSVLIKVFWGWPWSFLRACFFSALLFCCWWVLGLWYIVWRRVPESIKHGAQVVEETSIWTAWALLFLIKCAWMFLSVIIVQFWWL